MKVVSTYFYAAYGKYITRFRALPLDADMLRPVERRVLLSVRDVAKNAFTKSAKVVGHCIGNYHPHGDLPSYQTLVRYVNMGLIDGQGGFYTYGVNKNPPAAMRYTEVKQNEVIGKLMELTPYAPHEVLEFALEPVYIPSPIPIGLIGNRISYGISFHKTVYPTFTVDALFDALLALLSKKEVKLIPNQFGCDYVGDDSELKKLQETGQAELVFRAKYKEEHGKIHVIGEPLSWKPVVRCIEKNKLSFTDLSSTETSVYIDKKCVDSLTQSIKGNIVVVDMEGVPRTAGVNELILLSFSKYQEALENKLNDEKNKKTALLEDYKVLQRIKPYISKYSNMNRIIKKGGPEAERIIKKYPISKLVRIDEDIKQLEKEIKNIKDKLSNLSEHSIQTVKEMKKELS